MAIGFIGAGKVGFSLGKFFSQGGIPVTGYYSRNRESALEAALFTGTKQYDTIGELVHDCDALFLTVPDGEITGVYRQLTQYQISGKHICHCSGAMTAHEAFPGIDETGAFGYSIHPLFPVSSKLESYRELSGAFFCLEGDDRHIRQWQEQISSLGPGVQIISGEGKARYHAACAIASNLVCALVGESLDLLETCGFTRRDGLAALAPLMRSNMEHLIQDGPAGALTGPVERCDVGTVAKHLSCMSAPEEIELYRSASLKLVRIAEEKHPDRDYGPMRDLLK